MNPSASSATCAKPLPFLKKELILLNCSSSSIDTHSQFRETAGLKLEGRKVFDKLRKLQESEGMGEASAAKNYLP